MRYPIVDDNEFLPRRERDWDPRDYGVPSRASDAGPDSRSAAFYAEAIPCESCGEHQLHIGTDCSCNIPDEPIPQCRYEVLMQDWPNVGVMVDALKKHRMECPTCATRKMPKQEKVFQPKKRRAA